MRDPDLILRAQRAATVLERAWDRWRTLHGSGATPPPPVSSYVGYSLEEPMGQPRVVFGVALTVIGDPATAEDIAQQTFERAWRHAQVYDSRRGSVRAWLTTIAHNLAVDVVRARTSAPVDPQDLPGLLTAMTDTPERFAVAHDNAAGLRRALGSLPSGQGRAVAMAGIYGMTARQIAEAEGIPLGTAKTRIRDGMEKLRSAYLREDVGDD